MYFNKPSVTKIEAVDKLNQTKTETLTYDTNAMDNLEDWLLQTFTWLETTGKQT